MATVLSRRHRGNRIVRRTNRENESRRDRKGLAAANILLALIGLLVSVGPAFGQNARDWITGLPREPIHVKEWPEGKKVAICFVLYVEVWGYGHGPNFRSDMVARDPDVVDESFRQYAIEWGIPRVGRRFKAQGVPLSIAWMRSFPSQHPDVVAAASCLGSDRADCRPRHTAVQPSAYPSDAARRPESLRSAHARPADVVGVVRSRAMVSPVHANADRSAPGAERHRLFARAAWTQMSSARLADRSQAAVGPDRRYAGCHGGMGSTGRAWRNRAIWSGEARDGRNWQGRPLPTEPRSHSFVHRRPSVCRGTPVPRCGRCADVAQKTSRNRSSSG